MTSRPPRDRSSPPLPIEPSTCYTVNMTTPTDMGQRAPLRALAHRKRLTADKREAEATELRRQADDLEAEAVRREEASS